MSPDDPNPGSKKPKSAPSKYVGVRVPMELFEKLEKAARNQTRTISNYIIRLIEKDLEGSKGPKQSKEKE